MHKFSVVFRMAEEGWRPALWSFVAAPDAGFPEEFYRGFENGGVPGEEVYDPYVVWIADNTQAMVAFDYLLERGWELDRGASDPRFLAYLDD